MAKAETVTKKSLTDNFQYVSIGDELDNGWVVGGISPTTEKLFIIEPESSALKDNQTWQTGENHAEELRKQGHENARQPDDAELHTIYNEIVAKDRNHNAKIGTQGFDPYDKYWSSTSYLDAHSGADEETDKRAAVMYHYDGVRNWFFKVGADAKVRCIQDAPKHLKLKA